MAKYNINQKNNIIDIVKKRIQVRPPIIPNDKYEAYQLELKKAHERINKHQLFNIVLVCVLVSLLTYLAIK